MDVDAPSPRHVLMAGLALVAQQVSRLAFWTAVAFPAIYVAVSLSAGFATLSAPTVAGLVATNAVAVLVGHRHGAAERRERHSSHPGRPDSEPRPDAASGAGREPDPNDAPAVAPVGGD